MAAQKLIAVKEFCVHHRIKTDLVLELHRNEMIELVWVKRTGYIPEKSLPSLEKILRLHRDLQINLEGIQTILHLLGRLEENQAELTRLRNQLEFYSSI